MSSLLCLMTYIMINFYLQKYFKQAMPSTLEASLANFSFLETTKLLAGLSTIPELQPNALRIQALIRAAARYCKGTNIPSKSTIRSWGVSYLSSISMMEDPPEHPLLQNVCSSQGNYRLFESLVGSGSAYLIESHLRILARSDCPPTLTKLRIQFHSLLLLSDKIAMRLKLPLYVSSEKSASFELPSSQVLQQHAEALSFSLADLTDECPNFGISLLVTSDATSYELEDAEDDEQGFSRVMERYPVYQSDGQLHVLAPTYIGACISRFFFETIHSLQEDEWFAHSQKEDQVLQALKIFSFMEDLGQLPDPFEGQLSEKLSFFTNLYGLFDTDKIIQLSVIHFDPRLPLRDGLNVSNRIPDDVMKEFDEFLTDKVGPHFKKQGYEKGMHILISCHSGESCMLGTNGGADGWKVALFSMNDIRIITWDKGFSFGRIYKYTRELERLEDNEVTLGTKWDSMSCYSQWCLADYKFFNRNMAFPKTTMLMLAFDSHLPYKKEILNKVNPHVIYLYDLQKYVLFRRYGANVFFSYDVDKPIYVSDALSTSQVAYGVVEKGPIQWAIVCQVRNVSVSFSFAYEFWSMCLSRALQIVEHYTRSEPYLPSLMHFSISLVDGFDWAHLPSESEKVSTRFQIIAPHAVNIVFGTDIFELLILPKNFAEKKVIEYMLHAAFNAEDITIDEPTMARIISDIEPDEHSRYIHAFSYIPPTSLQGFPNISKERFLQEEDLSFFSVGLAWKILDVTQPTVIKGKKESISFLNSAVEKFWQLIKQELQSYNKESVLRSCLDNLNAIRSEREAWDATSKSMLSLSKDHRETLDVVSQFTRDRDNVTLSCRILAEMANCECKGKTVARRLDVDELLAQVSLLIHLALAFDAINYGFSNAEVTIHENGEIGIDRAMVKHIMPQYIQALDEQAFNRSVETYERLYAEQKSAALEEVYGKKFMEVFQDEFGISAELFLNCCATMHDLGYEKGAATYTITQDELFSELQKNLKMTDAEFIAFKNSFFLQARDAWDAVPKPYKEKDILPWRFQRRLSLVLRPVLSMENSSNPTLMINLSLIWSAFENYLYLINNGHYKTEFVTSEKFLSYLGDATNRQGKQFEQRVETAIRNKGWTVVPSVEMTSLGAPAKLGEVDLFAWSPTNPSHIFIIECKKLKLAKTIAEVGEQLSKFQGDAGDLLAKHLNRCEWIVKNSGAVIAYLKISSKSVKFSPLIVTSNPVPMQYYPLADKLKHKDVIDFDNLLTKIK